VENASLLSLRSPRGEADYAPSGVPQAQEQFKETKNSGGLERSDKE
jgi:hypothetical protein